MLNSPRICILSWKLFQGSTAVVIATVLLVASGSGAMRIQGIENATAPASNYDRFDNSPGFIGNPTNWSAGPPTVGDANPWTGVGRGVNGRWGTMISPSYIISATHFPPSGVMRFYYTNDPNGAYEDRTIVASEALQGSVPGNSGDVWIGKLDSAVSSNVAIYPVLSLPFLTDYNGLGISTFGTNIPNNDPNTSGTDINVRLGRNVINNGSAHFYGPMSVPAGTINGANVFEYNYDNPGVGPDESFVIAGDSGGPSFYLYAGAKPAIVGVHWFTGISGSTEFSADSFLAPYAADIQAGMNQLALATGTPQETLTTVAPVLGDLNLDGHFNGADILAMLNALAELKDYKSLHGMSTGYLNDIADFNHDGHVNNVDLQAMLDRLKTGQGSISEVPEPSTLVLAALSGLAVISFRFTRRRAR